jgi:hypothetical protein
MKAMLIRRYGGPDVFELGEVEMPLTGRGEALLRARGGGGYGEFAAVPEGFLARLHEGAMPSPPARIATTWCSMPYAALLSRAYARSCAGVVC